MKLFTTSIREQLLRNGDIRAQLSEEGFSAPDFLPVVKLFTPDAGCTWLLTELEPDDPDIAFGLCDLGLGFPELGSVMLSELHALRSRMGLPVERDLHFAAYHTLSVYAEAARLSGAITEDEQALMQAAARLAADATDGGVA
jgi:hypothetical protein